MSYSNWIWADASALGPWKTYRETQLRIHFACQLWQPDRQSRRNGDPDTIWEDMADSLLLISACKHILTKMSTTCDTRAYAHRQRRWGPNNSIWPSDICLSYRNTINNVIWHANLFMKITDERSEIQKQSVGPKKQRPEITHTHQLARWEMSCWAKEKPAEEKGKLSERQKANGTGWRKNQKKAKGSGKKKKFKRKAKVT